MAAEWSAPRTIATNLGLDYPYDRCSRLTLNPKTNKLCLAFSRQNSCDIYFTEQGNDWAFSTGPSLIRDKNTQGTYTGEWSDRPCVVTSKYCDPEVSYAIFLWGRRYAEGIISVHPDSSANKISDSIGDYTSCLRIGDKLWVGPDFQANFFTTTYEDQFQCDSKEVFLPMKEYNGSPIILSGFKETRWLTSNYYVSLNFKLYDDYYYDDIFICETSNPADNYCIIYYDFAIYGNKAYVAGSLQAKDIMLYTVDLAALDKIEQKIDTNGKKVDRVSVCIDQEGNPHIYYLTADKEIYSISDIAHPIVTSDEQPNEYLSASVDGDGKAVLSYFSEKENGSVKYIREK